MIQDYNEYFNFDAIQKDLEKLQYDEVIEKENLFKIFLSKRKNEEPLIPKGSRILKNIPILSEENISQLVSEFHSLKKLTLIEQEDLKKFIGERKAKAIREYLLKF